MEDIDNITESKDVMIDTLFEISSTFNGLLEKDEILRQLAIYLMGQFAIKSFAMYVLNNDNVNNIIKINLLFILIIPLQFWTIFFFFSFIKSNQ